MLRQLFASAATILVASNAAVAQQQPSGAPGGGGGGPRPPTVTEKIGVLPFAPAHLAADLRIRLEDAAAAGLVASGARVVTTSELARARTTAGLGTCADFICERRLAQITDARHWLRGRCQLDTSTYRVHLEVVEASTGAVILARDDTCDICTDTEAADLVNAAASALKAHLTRTQGASPVTVPAAVAPAAAGGATGAIEVGPTDHAAANGNQGASDAGGTAPANQAPAWRRVLPWVALAAGAAALTGGVYYLAIDGTETDDCGGSPPVCHQVNDTLWWGVPLVGLGAALATTGVILLRPSPTSPGSPPSSSSSAVVGEPMKPAATGTWTLPTLVIMSRGGVGIRGTF